MAEIIDFMERKRGKEEGKKKKEEKRYLAGVLNRITHLTGKKYNPDMTEDMRNKPPPVV